MSKFRLLLMLYFAVNAHEALAQCSADAQLLAKAPHTYAATSAAIASSFQGFSIVDRGAVSFDTLGEAGAMTVGYARVQPNTGSTTPAGFLTFQYRQNSVLVGQASVPATATTQSGRIYAEVGGPVNTGIAIANPNPFAVNITFDFTDSAGQSIRTGSFQLEANSQIARFLDQSPFSVGASIRGAMTFTASDPVGVIALRGYTNERSEFLITTLPVAALGGSGNAPVYMPHFADGGGWTTQVVLVNPSEQPQSGTVQFFSQGSGKTAGSPLTLAVDGQVLDTFPYSIPARSSVRLKTSGAGSTIRVGSVRIAPAPGNLSPSGLAIFSFRNGGVTVSEAGVPVLRPSSAFRMYEFECGDFIGQIQTGVAVTNPSGIPTIVNFDVTNQSGTTIGPRATVTIPAGGQIAKFIKELIPSLPHPFHGVVRISTPSAGGITVVGLRGDYNSRGDFLITTAMPTDETAPVTSSELIFPHLVDSGGYMTSFVLYSGASGQSSSGVLRFFTQSGQGMTVSIQ